MKGILLAIQFMTIVPVRVGGDVTAREIGRSAAFFPVAGALQGVCAAAALLASGWIFPPDITAGLLVLVLAVASGGFDLDGLADTADGLAVKSSGDRKADIERRLAVMKDSAAGAFGVLALIMAILLKYLFLKYLIGSLLLAPAAGLIFLLPVFSKWVTVPPMWYGRPARRDGLGSLFMENAGFASTLWSTCLTAAICIALVAAGVFDAVPGAAIFLAGAAAVLGATGYSAVRFLSCRFGGLTGDHFGALAEVSEILFLMGASVWLRRSF
ncbi:MAG: adenosylcobinamide-GDP ribazoletransferase [Thermodesulfovibrionales bacterium]